MVKHNNMLEEFRFANFKSFKDMTEFSMVATKDEYNETGSVYNENGDRLLKCAVIYGANGSGKSNLILAFKFMRDLIASNGVDDMHHFDEITFKLDKSTIEEPSFFEAVFFNDGKKYRYGFELTRSEIVAEWLFYSSSSRETNLFTREKENIIVGRSFKEGKGFEKNTKSTRLFLEVVAELNGKISESVRDWFLYTRLSSGIYSDNSYTMHVLNDHGEDDKSKILDVLQRFDLQIKDITLKPSGDLAKIASGFPKDLPASVRNGLVKYFDKNNYSPKPELSIVRNVYSDKKISGSCEFSLEDESDGTIRLIALAGYLVDCIEHGTTMIVDELEAKLHPLITRKIIDIFNSPDLNKTSAQLIFTTHDTNLLSGNNLRRDQIWFTERDRNGASHLYSLAEYKDLPRKDATFERDYIKGKYGAVPFIGDINEVFIR